ncbi:MAG: YggS family pyridoxal phosphate-dependent enzyme, partial [Nitrospirota bacterium]|nr:YggS family pyridoxal phosphate-dependent enzyme [Nitrospirota bacterium]
MADTRGAETIARNISILYGNIRKAAERVGREPTAVRLIAATKFVSVDRIRQAIEAGVRIFGENRLQEALPK